MCMYIYIYIYIHSCIYSRAIIAAAAKAPGRPTKAAGNCSISCYSMIVYTISYVIISYMV